MSLRSVVLIEIPPFKIIEKLCSSLIIAHGMYHDRDIGMYFRKKLIYFLRRSKQFESASVKTGAAGDKKTPGEYDGRILFPSIKH